MKKGTVLVLIIVLIAVIIVVIGFFVLTSPKKEVVNNPPVNESSDINQNPENNENQVPVVNNTVILNNSVMNNSITPPETVNVSFGNSLKFAIKASNPQYKSGQDMTILYTIENAGNKTIEIPTSVDNGIEIKNSGGWILNYSGSNSGIKVLSDTISLPPKNKTSGSFVIGGSDYDLITNGNSADGYYNTITAHIGDVNSNRVIVRILLK